MLEESLGGGTPHTRSFEVGQSVEGLIVAIESDSAFIDIGGKGEATMSLDELRGDSGEIEVRVGDRVKAMVVSTGTELVLSRKMALGAAAREQIQAAFSSGLPVEGRIESVNKGGYEVRIAGVRAFCPMGQIDIVRTEEPAQHVGRVYTFRIIELREGGKNLVVSRRALLEEEAREKAREVMRTVVPGAVLSGRVASVSHFGAFVELGGGVQGLLHVSEMGWSRASTPAEVVQAGQVLAVQVVKVEDQGRKISLSLKHLQADPWLKVSAAYSVGQMLQGRVTRLADFGAFVELEPGIEALAHVSTFPPGERDWKALVPPGSTATFRIESIDVKQRRIGAALREGSAADGPASGSGAGQPKPAEKGLGSLADQLRAAMEPRKKNDN